MKLFRSIWSRCNLKSGARRGQSMVILAITFLALLAFVGLVTDVGSLYIAYTQLKRSVDAAAIAAANNIKNPQMDPAVRKTQITEAARETILFNGIQNIASLEVYLCTDTTGRPVQFVALCNAPGGSMRKLAWVQARQQAPVYFLHLFGVNGIEITSSAVGEAATVDLVLVFDTSESMGKETTGYNPRDFNPATCNSANTCQPLLDAKNAATTLVNNFFPGYDRIAIVTFDYDAEVVFNLSDNTGTTFDPVYAAINGVNLHDDVAIEMLAWGNGSPMDGSYRTFNPLFPDDRDGDGLDADSGLVCTDTDRDLWDDTTGDPCDRDDILDAFDWNRNGDHDDDDDDPVSGTWEDTSVVSTCSGCGIRMATSVLTQVGRPTSLWVMVFLSDGVANLSDRPDTFNQIPSDYPYGYCGHNVATNFWSTYCIDWNESGNAGRHCIDANSNTCPPGSTPATTSGPYSVEDYAMDMIDAAALLTSTNANEPRGENIIVYVIGLGDAHAGEGLLRYMANVGMDGSRANDACDGVATRQHCGHYYYAPTGNYLNQIFERIAKDIYTKLSR